MGISISIGGAGVGAAVAAAGLGVKRRPRACQTSSKASVGVISALGAVA
ncbi:hypothetical protein ACFXPQ_21330 [Streptomyces lydicus]